MIRLRELREAAGLEVKDMCRKLGVADSRYRKWESGTNGVPLDYALMICDVLHCTLDELSGHTPKIVGAVPRCAAPCPSCAFACAACRRMPRFGAFGTRLGHKKRPPPPKR